MIAPATLVTIESWELRDDKLFMATRLHDVIAVDAAWAHWAYARLEDVRGFMWQLRRVEIL